MMIYPHPFFLKKVCVFFISSTAMFFAFAIIEYKKFRRPGNFFSLGGKKFPGLL